MVYSATDVNKKINQTLFIKHFSYIKNVAQSDLHV